MKKFSTILVCLYLLGCASAPKGPLIPLDPAQRELFLSAILGTPLPPQREGPIFVIGTKDASYGFSKEKPIATGSIRRSYKFLQEFLRDEDGLPYEVERIGNFGDVNGDGIIDGYKLTRTRTGRSITLFVNPYKSNMMEGRIYAPFGFAYLPNEEVIAEYDRALALFLETGKEKEAKQAFLKIQDKTSLSPLHRRVG